MKYTKDIKHRLVPRVKYIGLKTLKEYSFSKITLNRKVNKAGAYSSELESI